MAVATDVARRIIPNRFVLLVLASGITLRLLSAPSPFWLGLLGPIAVLLALGLLASHDLVGWGDAKLITAVSVAVPADRLLTLLLAIALAGGLLSCLYLAARCVLRRIAASPDRARTDGYWGARGSGTPLLSAAMAGPGPVSRPAVGWPAAALRLGGLGDVDRRAKPGHDDGAPGHDGGAPGRDEGARGDRGCDEGAQGDPVAADLRPSWLASLRLVAARERARILAGEPMPYAVAIVGGVCYTLWTG